MVLDADKSYRKAHKEAFKFYKENDFQESLGVMNVFLKSGHHDGYYEMEALSFIGMVYSALKDSENRTKSYLAAYEISLQLGNSGDIYYQAFEIMCSLLASKRSKEAKEIGEYVLENIELPNTSALRVFYLSIGNAYFQEGNLEKVDETAEKLLFISKKVRSKSRLIERMKWLY